MPYANNQGVNIHYEVRGTGLPIVFNHGFPRDRTTWYPYAERLEDKFECILIDGRGMGLTDKPHEIEAYTFERKVSDTIAVMDELAIDKAVYWGYSMGGGIGWAAARFAPERFHAFIIGGSEPFRTEADRDLIRQSAARIRSNPEGFPGQDVEALYASQMGSTLGPNFEDVLPTITRPCLVYVGEEDYRFDAIRRAANLIPNVSFVTLPGKDHTPAHQDVESVITHALPFLDRVQAGIRTQAPSQQPS
jgi:pimeloyl-ACP methyl ester carboxylesterase